MKGLLIVLTVFVSSLSFSQIYGDIALDKRPIVKQIEYGIAANYTGQIVFDIVVNEKGDVTVCKLDKTKTNIKSTPTVMKAKNRILMDLKFKASSLYPKYHNGEIVIKVYKKN